MSASTESSESGKPTEKPRFASLTVRVPDIGADGGAFIWSQVPEFSLGYNGYSLGIPQFEYYLNNIMRTIAEKHGENDPALKKVLVDFIKQEAVHSRIHVRYNKRMEEIGIDGMKEMIAGISAHLKTLTETRSLAFNAAYCAGFESVATFAAKYLYEKCDDYFVGADATGANLLLWHVAEEFEHRSVCHDAFDVVSGNYFTRIHGLLYAFWHVGGSLRAGEQLVLKHYGKDLPEAERKASRHRSNALFLRKMLYVAPRMMQILLPWYHPSRLKFPERIRRALEVYARPGAITKPLELGPA